MGESLELKSHHLHVLVPHGRCGGEVSFKYRDKVEEKWKETVNKLAIYRTKGIKNRQGKIQVN